MTSGPLRSVASSASPNVAVTPALADAWPPAAPGRPLAEAVPTGLADLDLLSPLRAGRLTLITGAPGAGVTSLLLRITAEVAAGERPVVFVSDHLDPDELTGRLIAQLAAVDLPGLPARLAVADDPILATAVRRLEQLQLVLVDARTGCTTVDLIRTLEQLTVAAGPPGLLVIDRAAALTLVGGRSRRHWDADPTCLRQLLQAVAGAPCPVLAAERPSRSDYPEPELITPTCTV
jgi:replicative DNA helicase